MPTVAQNKILITQKTVVLQQFLRMRGFCKTTCRGTEVNNNGFSEPSE